MKVFSNVWSKKYISSTWEAEAGGSLKVQASVGYTVAQGQFEWRSKMLKEKQKTPRNNNKNKTIKQKRILLKHTHAGFDKNDASKTKNNLVLNYMKSKLVWGITQWIKTSNAELT